MAGQILDRIRNQPWIDAHQRHYRTDPAAKPQAVTPGAFIDNHHIPAYKACS
jgi:hypothetical protein